ncbi:cytochrome c peroxidase [Rubinisphaera margarita]|uniref:cytochrome c peroxidase n=1 Tax=Rubinisphaera margarita TaxID=2909586 RepID=UPI001EE7CD55|nr:cytochrome c peroxidase [Rubinisphaera margarita]MCG6154480.1 hypothetical protein [Rubinisphaera margarita]
MQSFLHQFRFSPATICATLAIAVVSLILSSPLQADTRVRPRALKLSPDGSLVATANRIAGTVTVATVDPLQQVAEIEVGSEPMDVLWINDTELAVTVHRDRTVQLLSLNEGQLQRKRSVSVSACPVGMVFAPEAQELIVAVQHPDSVLAIDLTSGEIVRRYETGDYPRYLCLAPDESWFCVTSELPGALTTFDRESGEVLSRQIAHQTAFNLGQPTLLEDQFVVVPLTINRDFPVTEGNIARGWVVNNRLARFRVPHGPALEQRQMSLDMKGHGSADLTTTALSPSTNKLLVTASGVHELIMLDRNSLEWPTSEPHDFASHQLSDSDQTMKRIPLSGRPVDVDFLNDTTVLVANEMDDRLQKVDLQNGEILDELLLADSSHESQIAQGERIFYDGRRSRDGWMSCHTCHFDGHTSGQVFDTFNDATYDTKKLTLSLHDVANTEPWTWHGWQPDLTDSMTKSLRDTMHGSIVPTDDDARALAAYLGTLTLLSATPDVSEADLAAGRELFYGKAGCISCHEEPNYESSGRFSVSRLESHSIYQVLNPPPLRGVSSRRRFLHHGYAHSIDQVLRLYHRPADTTGADLTETERRQLITFLSAL